MNHMKNIILKYKKSAIVLGSIIVVFLLSCTPAYASYIARDRSISCERARFHIIDIYLFGPDSPWQGPGSSDPAEAERDYDRLESIIHSEYGEYIYRHSDLEPGDPVLDEKHLIRGLCPADGIMTVEFGNTYRSLRITCSCPEHAAVDGSAPDFIDHSH